MAADFDELVAGRRRAATAGRRHRHPHAAGRSRTRASRRPSRCASAIPGTGVVILSQYDDPEYAIALLSEGAAGYAYLLKDRVGDGNRLARAIREVATGGSMLDPEIVHALVAPGARDGELTADEDELLHQVAEGRPVKAIAATLADDARGRQRRHRGAFLKLAKGASAGQRGRAAPAAPAADRRSSTARSRARR